ncbi:uncharacterized protein EI90DRAFT_3050825 [Cantharellus anzutake]|uniref:uncharacterized protein n=1 Tax=Cantharellus anzutake TaxID=1750568 RepID=UPI001905E3FA|nr:uncharacterized protein EI90DRAFT_3050825 [Cantharellus anzutake]KAF8334051.1 hypothetical protein EI90DRAFT_3050825 [Cantharellus anzutake]
MPFAHARDLAQRLLRNKVIVAYELWKSLDALRLQHPADLTRDLATYLPVQTIIGAEGDNGFQKLVQQFMNRTIRNGFHHPVEDARAAMDLYRSCATDWEALITTSVWPCLLPPEEFRLWYL